MTLRDPKSGAPRVYYFVHASEAFPRLQPGWTFRAAVRSKGSSQDIYLSYGGRTFVNSPYSGHNLNCEDVSDGTHWVWDDNIPKCVAERRRAFTGRVPTRLTL